MPQTKLFHTVDSEVMVSVLVFGQSRIVIQPHPTHPDEVVVELTRFIGGDNWVKQEIASIERV